MGAILQMALSNDFSWMKTYFDSNFIQVSFQGPVHYALALVPCYPGADYPMVTKYNTVWRHPTTSTMITNMQVVFIRLIQPEQ